jgi:PhzF family phenazine biosynthesis protein
MKVLVHCINSFTHNGSGGNPAGVVLNANKLTATQMQQVAAHVGFSETAFVSDGTDCDFTVRFFTPNEEVDFCGHATLATFSLMYSQNIITNKQYSQQTKAGQLNVSVFNDGLVTMQQTLPNYLGRIDSLEVANILDIDVDEFKQTNLPCEIISTGLADVIVPIPYGYLDKITPNDAAIATFSKKYNVIGLHLFELSTESKDITASCRNFAPLFGIPEESATGSATGALACYLTKHNVTSSNKYDFEQGRTMQSPSRLTAKITETDNKITLVEVSGRASLIETKTITID